MDTPSLGDRAATEAGFVAIVAALIVVGASVATVALFLGEDPSSSDQSQFAFDFAATAGADPGPQDCDGRFGDVQNASDLSAGDTPDGVLNVTYVGTEPIPVSNVILREPNQPNRGLVSCSGVTVTELTTNTTFAVEVNGDDILYFNRTDENGIPVEVLGRWERSSNASIGTVTLTTTADGATETTSEPTATPTPAPTTTVREPVTPGVTVTQNETDS